MELRKLSDIIIEIAKQGLSCEKYAHSEVMHALMALAHSMEPGDGLGKLYSKRTVHWFHKPAPAVGKNSYNNAIENINIYFLRCAPFPPFSPTIKIRPRELDKELLSHKTT